MSVDLSDPAQAARFAKRLDREASRKAKDARILAAQGRSLDQITDELQITRDDLLQLLLSPSPRSDRLLPHSELDQHITFTQARFLMGAVCHRTARKLLIESGVPVRRIPGMCVMLIPKKPFLDWLRRYERDRANLHYRGRDQKRQRDRDRQAKLRAAGDVRSTKHVLSAAGTSAEPESPAPSNRWGAL